MESSTKNPAAPSFNGLRVVAFESRMAAETATLIERFGGRPIVAPAMREAPLEDNHAALGFGQRLIAREVDIVVFLTGVGVRELFRVLETRHTRATLVAAFTNVMMVARGPKPVVAMREIGLQPGLVIPEPNTWREILAVLSDHAQLVGKRIAIQEYGASNRDLLAGLEARGAEVLAVPVYRWTLPIDRGPLRAAISAIAAGAADVVLFTSSSQVTNVMQLAEADGLGGELRHGLASAIVASIGPVCSQELRAHGIAVDLEPSHPKLGHLVKEVAARAEQILARKRSGSIGRDEESNAQALFNASPADRESTRRSAAEPSTLAERSAASRRVRELHIRERVCEVRSESSIFREAVEVLQENSAPSSNNTADPLANHPMMLACQRERAPYTPIWLMRQAGRYLPEYRRIRAKHSFLEMCRHPDLAAEVTVTAVDRLGVDAAIIFADILLPLVPMGVGLRYEAGDGPIIERPVRADIDLDRIPPISPLESLSFVADAIKLVKRSLGHRTPLIGFAGAPFTLASYLVEGGSSRQYQATKTLMYTHPRTWDRMMEMIARITADYLKMQIDAGADIVQLFDSWVGNLGPGDYRRFVLSYTKNVIAAIGSHVPVIHFGTVTGNLLELMREAGGDVIGLDWRVDLAEAWERLGSGVGVQGNLDPVALFADIAEVKRRAGEILGKAAGRPGHIFNLGHGILPDTPVDHVIALIDAVHEMSGR